MEGSVWAPTNSLRGREPQVMVHCILPKRLTMSQFLHKCVLSRVTDNVHVGWRLVCNTKQEAPRQPAHVRRLTQKKVALGHGGNYNYPTSH
jgi:hypothetical protein